MPNSRTTQDKAREASFLLDMPPTLPDNTKNRTLKSRCHISSSHDGGLTWQFET
jgi:hypothetical protein